MNGKRVETEAQNFALQEELGDLESHEAAAVVTWSVAAMSCNVRFAKSELTLPLHRRVLAV